jgi:hypothetical protein
MRRRDWILGSAAASLLVAGARSSVVHALCVAPRFERWVHGAIGASRPASAGFVVVEGTETAAVTVGELATLRLVSAGGMEIAFASQPIAESIAALRPEVPAPPGRYSLRGFRSEQPISIELTAVPLTPPSPPRVGALHHQRTVYSGRGRPMTSGSLRLDVDASVPVGTMLIARWIEESVPRDTWGIVTEDGSRRVALLAAIGRCSGHGRFPPQGIAITIHTLDVFGQLSAGSTPVRVPPPS